MYHYNNYKTNFPNYYNYYMSHSVPRVHYYGPLILRSGDKISLNSFNNNPNSISLKLNQCQNGPKYYFTVRVNGKIFRTFLGDVNDFFNVQCLYMMNAIVSIGSDDHAEKIYEIFNNPSKSVNMSGKQIELNPFKGSEYVPENVKLNEVSENVKIMTFDLQDSSLPSKSIVFYQFSDLSDNEDLFRDLSREAPSGNVLFIVDQLQRKSVNIFRHFLVKYKHYSSNRINRFRYKNVYLFPRARRITRIIPRTITRGITRMIPRNPRSSW